VVTARYDDPCGIARALEVLGDRWALLVVRELVFGPRRFAQIRNGLHGVSPNVLSQRLRELEDAGVVRRELLAAPANVAVYGLTDRGQALEPVLLELGRWGSREPITTAEELSVNALLLALKTVFLPAAAVDATFRVHVGGESFLLTAAHGGLHVVRDGTEQAAAVTFECDVATLRSVAFGRLSVAAAVQAGRLAVSGDRRLAARFGRMFPVPA
jgi:DNA-binding HxlR family transcriptional regulator